MRRRNPVAAWDHVFGQLSPLETVLILTGGGAVVVGLTYLLVKAISSSPNTSTSALPPFTSTSGMPAATTTGQSTTPVLPPGSPGSGTIGPMPPGSPGAAYQQDTSGQ